MQDLQADFMRLPKHLRFYIWTLLFETFSIDIEHHLTLLEGDGTTKTLSARHLGPSRTNELGSQITEYQWGGRGIALIKLAEAYKEGKLSFVGTTLKLNLHNLFSEDTHYLARAKKILMLAIHFRFISAVELHVWGINRCFSIDLFECVPFHLFFTQFAPLLWDTLLLTYHRGEERP